MEKIIDLINKSKGNQDSVSSRKSSNNIGEKWAVALFLKLKAIYGNRWTSQWETEEEWKLAFAEWIEGINGLSGEQIQRATDYCREELDWPPSIATFRKAALNKSNGQWQHNNSAYRIHDPRQLLGMDVSAERKRCAVINLAEMKKKLQRR